MNVAGRRAAPGHESRRSILRLLVAAGPDGTTAGARGAPLGMAPVTRSFPLAHLSRVGPILTGRIQIGRILTGPILTGLARCMAMVSVGNGSAPGFHGIGRRPGGLPFHRPDRVHPPPGRVLRHPAAAVVPPGRPGRGSIGPIAERVFVDLDTPWVACMGTRAIRLRGVAQTGYHARFVPKIGPISRMALRFPRVVLFRLEGPLILTLPPDALRIAIPLLFCCIVMLLVSFAMGRQVGANCQQCATWSFTAGNNDERAIAVAIVVSGMHSGTGFAVVSGPRVAVPAMIALDGLSFGFQQCFFAGERQRRRAEPGHPARHRGRASQRRRSTPQSVSPTTGDTAWNTAATRWAGSRST